MYIVDRIEENMVVCEKEDKTFIDIDISKFPPDIKAGDLVREVDGKYVIDEQQTTERTKKIADLMDSLWE